MDLGHCDLGNCSKHYALVRGLGFQRLWPENPYRRPRLGELWALDYLWMVDCADLNVYLPFLIVVRIGESRNFLVIGRSIVSAGANVLHREVPEERPEDGHDDKMIDFDSIDEWGPLLASALSALTPASVGTKMREARPEYVEDARDLFLDLLGRDAAINAALAWIRSTTVICYHGTRLRDDELASIRANGLVPLKAEARRGRLARALSPHQRWSEVEKDLDAVMKAHGPGTHAGRREGQVHLALSRAGLTNRFNHYLTHGSEFDQHVAHALLGEGGVRLLRRDGKARIIKVAVPGDMALDAAHPVFKVNDILARGEVPTFIDHFLRAWSFRLSRADFQSRTLKVDCAMRFRATLPPEWIMEIETLEGV
jgi:hypothetical protein